MTLTYISCSSDFYTFYVNVPLSLGCMIRKVSAEDISIRGNGTGLEYMCLTRHFVYIFYNPVFQVSTAKNEINLFNNHILIEAPVTFAPAGAMTPSAEFLLLKRLVSVLYNSSCAVSKHRLRRRKSKLGLPFWTLEIKDAVRKSKLAHVEWKRAGRPQDQEHSTTIHRQRARRALRR